MAIRWVAANRLIRSFGLWRRKIESNRSSRRAILSPPYFSFLFAKANLYLRDGTNAAQLLSSVSTDGNAILLPNRRH